MPSPLSIGYQYPSRFQLAVLVLLSVLIGLIAGCRTYYRADSHQGAPALREVNKAINSGRIFVIWNNGHEYLARDVQLTETSLVTTLEELPYGLKWLRREVMQKPGTAYSPRKHQGLTEQIIIHTRPSAEVAVGDRSLSLDDITGVEVYSRDTGRTIASHTIGVVGATAAVLVVLTAVALATKDSCPFVYTWDGTGYTLAGEIYGGAIAPSLERSDFMALPSLQPIDGYFQLRIANELKEHQFINLARMIHVEHPEGTRVVVDRHGTVHTIEEPRAPLSATSSGARDLRLSLLETDHTVFSFDDGEGDVGHVDLTFAKPADAVSAKLLVHAKAAHWLDYVFDRYTEQFGVLYNRWHEQISTRTPEELEAWYLSQSIPIKVFVEDRLGEWAFAGHYEMVGPLTGTRELVMAVDVSHSPIDQVRVRLETGFSFWEVDAVAMDFSVNRAVTTVSAAPDEATTSDGRDVGTLLSKDDNEYLKQFEIGDHVTLRFTAPVAQEGTVTTSFLHAKGYYTPLREYSGIPNLARLLQFKEAGRFTAFAKTRYLEFTGGDANAVAHAGPR